MRSWLRRTMFALLRKVLATDDGRDILTEAMPGNHACSFCYQPAEELLAESPYADLPALGGERHDGEGAVFISGRFRSGSTLLWNIFRHVANCTAYYEPLNERQWFNPRVRGSQTDATHRGVVNYWHEYEGLEELGKYYREDWIRRDLYMPEAFWAPELRRYIEILLKRAAGRPVLQFNRVDFRLPWLRAQFPRAKVVHLYRHPRDQWISSLQGGSAFPLDGQSRDFGPCDKFYLLMWARDLAHHFPFLDVRRDGHPYELFYFIWKLSYLFGRQYADVSLGYEQLLRAPARELSRLFDLLQLDAPIDEALLKLIEPNPSGRWRSYADEAWFVARETRCERILAQFFAAHLGAAAPLERVRVEL